jgi:hypothetical protein
MDDIESEGLDFGESRSELMAHEILRLEGDVQANEQVTIPPPRNRLYAWKSSSWLWRRW